MTDNVMRAFVKMPGARIEVGDPVGTYLGGFLHRGKVRRFNKGRMCFVGFATKVKEREVEVHVYGLKEIVLYQP